MAKDVGYIEFPGLEGHIKTGCTSSPQLKSRYCQKHASHSLCTVDGDQVVETILEKKTTRNTTFYKVQNYY